MSKKSLLWVPVLSLIAGGLYLHITSNAAVAVLVLLGAAAAFIHRVKHDGHRHLWGAWHASQSAGKTSRRRSISVAVSSVIAVSLCGLCEVLCVVKAPESLINYPPNESFYWQSLSSYFDGAPIISMPLMCLVAVFLWLAIFLRHPIFVHRSVKGRPPVDIIVVVEDASSVGKKGERQFSFTNLISVLLGSSSCAGLIGLSVWTNGATSSRFVLGAIEFPFKHIVRHFMFTDLCFISMCVYQLWHTTLCSLNLVRGAVVAHAASIGSACTMLLCNVGTIVFYIRWVQSGMGTTGNHNLDEWISVSFMWLYFLALSAWVLLARVTTKKVM